MKTDYVFPYKHNDPQQWYWFKEGFSRSELHKIYADLQNIPFERATTLGSTDGGEVRRSNIKWLPRDEHWGWVYEKLINMAVEANNSLWHFDLHTAPEQIQYTEYDAAELGHYDWHQDIGHGGASLRKVSITVQLSESNEYDGGDLEIWQGGKVVQSCQRGAGVVVVFPSYMMHRVTKVTKGTRRSFVLWVGGQHYK